MRQTDLTAEQIILRLEDGDQEFPICFYINELGELAQTGDTTAEGVLHSYLDADMPPMERAPAYLHLKLCTHPLSLHTRQLLREFEEHPLNRDIVIWAHEQLTRIQQTTVVH